MAQNQLYPELIMTLVGKGESKFCLVRCNKTSSVYHVNVVFIARNNVVLIGCDPTTTVAITKS